MKPLVTFTIGAALLASVSVNAQQKTKQQKSDVKSSELSKSENSLEAFKNKNKDIKNIRWHQGKVIILEKKDGTLERYRLDNGAEEGKAKSLYGELPPPPPPPPPALLVPPPPPPIPQV